MSQLNLIPYELRAKKSKGLRARDLIVVLVVLGCIIGAGIVLPDIMLNNLNSQEASLKAEINRGAALMNESSKLQTQINDYKKYISMVNSATMLKIPVYDKIKGIEKYLVQDVAFDNLTFGNGVINIDAKSKDYNSICIFVANVQEAREYKGARIGNISFNQQESQYSCVISINY